MTPPPRPAPLDDEQLDSLLEAAVSVAPSPAFRARVAARIASEPPRERGGWLVGPALATAAAVTMALTTTLWRTTPARDTHVPVVAGRAWSVSASPAAVEPVSRSSLALFRYVPSSAVIARFDRRELEAFTWFVSRASSGVLQPSEFALDDLATAAAIPPVDIAPIAVMPIGLANTYAPEGEPQP